MNCNSLLLIARCSRIGIANELMAEGIKKDHIVLGFKSPFKRQFTDFAQE